MMDGYPIWPVFHYLVNAASGRIACGTTDQVFVNYSTLSLTQCDVTEQLTVGISRENLPLSYKSRRLM